jgi:UDP-glucose 4-epimerase
MKILVTGGAGYIGSHTVVALVEAGHEVVIIDDLSNSYGSSIKGIESIIGRKVEFHEKSCNDLEFLDELFANGGFDGVIHFAASKLVGESVRDPIKYYRNNVNSTLNILERMVRYNVKNIVFSSTCTVYGQPKVLPVTEDTPIQQAESPYGNTKKINEDILRDVSKISEIKAIALRYFNVIGAHPSSKIGNNPNTPPESIIPIINEYAAGKRDKLVVFGKDFDTPDGYQIRDYIHVMDLARAHVMALEYASKQQGGMFDTFNIGTGKGSSVMEIIKTYEKVNDIRIEYEIGDPRPGDIVKTWADASKANEVLGWKAELTLEDALRDDWNWGKKALLGSE